jgi:hypothetical protein
MTRQRLFSGRGLRRWRRHRCYHGTADVVLTKSDPYKRLERLTTRQSQVQEFYLPLDNKKRMKSTPATQIHRESLARKPRFGVGEGGCGPAKPAERAVEGKFFGPVGS